MKRIAFISILLSMLCFGCGEKNMNNDDTPQCGCEEENMNNDDPIQSLEGTRWKLAGIMDTETGSLKVLEPKDCKECFTLVFNSDHKATVRSIDNETFTLDLQNLTPYVNFEDILHMELYDKDGKYYDGSSFRRSVIITKSYSVTHDELILYSNYYNLLFKLQQP